MFSAWRRKAPPLHVMSLIVAYGCDKGNPRAAQTKHNRSVLVVKLEGGCAQTYNVYNMETAQHSMSDERYITDFIEHTDSVSLLDCKSKSSATGVSTV